MLTNEYFEFVSECAKELNIPGEELVGNSKLITLFLDGFSVTDAVEEYLKGILK